MFLISKAFTQTKLGNPVLHLCRENLNNLYANYVPFEQAALLFMTIGHNPCSEFNSAIFPSHFRFGDGSMDIKQRWVSELVNYT